MLGTVVCRCLYTSLADVSTARTRLRVRAALNNGLSDAPADVTFEHHPNFSVWSTADADFAAARLKRIEHDIPASAR